MLTLAWLQLGIVFTWAVTILPVFFALAFGLSALRRENGSSRACGVAALALIAMFVLLVFLPASRRY
jgi:membrane protein implicated in regulation of membrane protease activity